MRDNPTMDKIFGALTFSKRFPRLGHGPKTKEHRDCQLTREDTARSWDFIFFIISLANLLLLLSLAATNIDKISEYYFLWISSFVHLVMAIAKTEHSYIYSGWLGLGVTFVAVLFSFAPYASVIFFQLGAQPLQWQHMYNSTRHRTFNGCTICCAFCHTRFFDDSVLLIANISSSFTVFCVIK